MTHPRLEVLQDYFENALGTELEERVSIHVHSCDKCTSVLADFASIETSVKRSEKVEISQAARERIFASAKVILEEKRKTPEPGKIEAFWADWKDFSFPELKVPALQLCSLSIALFVLVAVEKEKSQKIEIFEPLSDEVQIYTYNDIEDL